MGRRVEREGPIAHFFGQTVDQQGPPSGARRKSPKGYSDKGRQGPIAHFFGQRVEGQGPPTGTSLLGLAGCADPTERGGQVKKGNFNI